MKVKTILVCLCTAAAVYAGPEDTVTVQIGEMSVSLLVERITQGNPGIILADQALVQQYVSGGFSHQTNAVLVKSPGQIVLVDTGFGIRLFDNLAALGVSPEQVTAVLLTHMHGDHIGGLLKDGKAAFPNALLYVAEQEKDFWIPPAKAAPGGTSQTDPRFAAAARALEPYSGRVRTFRPQDVDKTPAEILPGIAPIAAFGHTPGHTVFLLESRGNRFLIWGDIMHVRYIQFARPGINMTYDMDGAAARESRQRIFRYAARNRIPVTGMHIASPAIGILEEQEGDGYTFRELFSAMK